MIDRIRKNFALFSWVASLAFIVTYVYSNFGNLCATATYLNLALGTGVELNTYWFVVLSGVLSAVISMLLTRFLTTIIVNYLKIHYLPQKEYSYFILLFFALSNLILGSLRLLYYITPVINVYGEILFRFVAGVVAYAAFFLSSKKIYLNSSTAPYYFKVSFTLFCIYFAVVLASGLIQGVRAL